MNNEKNLQRVLENIVKDWKQDAKIASIEIITPDASLRRYYRLHLQDADISNCVAMVFDSKASPEVGGEQGKLCDEAWVELQLFLSTQKISVPDLYVDAREKSVLLIEDLGNNILAGFLDSPASQAIPMSQTAHYFREAVETIVKLQNLSLPSNFFVSKRHFSQSAYYNEMMEFVDFLMPNYKCSSNLIKEVLIKFFQSLSFELSQMQVCFTHRDYHAGNLLIDANNKLRIIDFQDALMATRYYDLASLLNDRDIDKSLGEKLYQDLLCQFYEGLNKPEGFFKDYYKVLLQRDIKVAGRFAKLKKLRGLEQYAKWIPGTLERIKKNLNLLAAESEGSKVFKDTCLALSEFQTF